MDIPRSRLRCFQRSNGSGFLSCSKRIKAVLDIFASMGGMSRELKDVATQIVDLDDTEGPHEQVSVQDSMRLLIELDDLMWRGRQDWRRAALMTMLSADERLRP